MTNKKKAKINVFDIFIALIVVAAIAVVYMFFTSRDNIVEVNSNATVTYKVEFQNVYDEIAYTTKIGDPIRDGVSKINVGEIVDFDVSPTIRVTEDTIAGVAKNVVVPERFNVTLTIEAPAVVTDGSVSVNGTDILVGQQMHMQSKHFSGSGFCVAVSYE